MNPQSHEVAQANAVKIVSGIAHMATLPEVTTHIIELVENPSSSARDLHQLVATDPALTTRVLKVVNSSFYGLPRQIGSINRAISLLGLNAVKNISVAASLGRIFKQNHGKLSIDPRDLWSHSVATATMAFLIAQESKSGSADEAFLAGLLHDVGLMVELQHDVALFQQVVGAVETNAEGAPLSDLRARERELFKVDHPVIGAALCEAWKFPQALVLATAHHHDPSLLEGDEASMPWIVHVAERVSTAQLGGFRLDLPSLEIDTAAYDAIGVGPVRMEALAATLPSCLGEVELSMAA